MPGISDKFALKHAIIDSVVVSSSTRERLRSRGLNDFKPAMRLRRDEIRLFRKYSESVFNELQNHCTESLKNNRTGNHYFYKWAYFIMKMIPVKGFQMKCRSDEVQKSLNLAVKLAEIKVPAELHHENLLSLPEGYSKVHCMYIALRSLYDKLMGLFSSSGKNRGILQSISTKNRNDDEYKKKLSEWEEKEDESLQKEGLESSYISRFDIKGVLSIRLARLSDLTYIQASSSDEKVDLLLTHNHFERCCILLKQLSNVLLGVLLSYGMEGTYDSYELVTDMISYLKQMFKIGIKDDLSVGEAGKAVTDLFKAKLSQTDELPWNNYTMLMRTYSDKRQSNAIDLWSEFVTLRHDTDVKLNVSYLWKLAVQPDSDIRKDFIELTTGLSEPNQIKEGKADLIEYAIRRAVIVGALRENRQVHIEPEPGVVVAPELLDAVSRSSVTEKNLRSITYGMMKGIKVKVNNVFPDPHDVSHLIFKDKSSAVDKLSLRKIVEERKNAEYEIKDLEDEIILANAEKNSEEFMERLRTEGRPKGVDWAFKATANDIISSLDDNISDVFREAERKYKFVTRRMREIRDKYGTREYIRTLKEWAAENPEALINTATEPKYGEVHKRSVRIFYMFEKGMKTFLSQFERIARIVGYYIKGAEIVKGDRAREEHMNILSSAHRAGTEGILAYQILFDLSKFSQKFNHKIIDAAAKVIGELVDYPDFSQISDLFKAAFLFVSARGVDEHFVGVLGAFEGFLNFLWTNIHATVMDIALKDCGRSGDLAAYSDDGLLVFTMNSKPDDDVSLIRNELLSIIESIKGTYADFGLDFNLGKTLISRNLSEFLGVIQYKGHRLPTWMKELCHLGVPDETNLIKSLGQEITDITSQMAASIKAGMQPYAATLLGYSELFMGPGRRLQRSTRQASTKFKISCSDNLEEKAMIAFLCLNQAFGGVRVPDPITTMMTADFDPIVEMLVDVRRFSEVFDDDGKLYKYIRDKTKPTENYTSLFLGSSPVHTEGVEYTPSLVREAIIKKAKKKMGLLQDHPLDRKRCPRIHKVLECISNLYLPTISGMARYIIPVIMYNRIMAPTKSSSIARILKKNQVRAIQHLDSRKLVDQMGQLLMCLSEGDSDREISADELYKLSFPALDFSPAVPSARELATFRKDFQPTAYEIPIRRLDRLDDRGSYRFLNQSYRDDLVPPLVTTDVNIHHLMNAPDLVSHCMRGLYSELISTTAQGHDLALLADAICELNQCTLVMPSILTSLQDVRKVAVANKKKSIHRVYWSEPTKSVIRLVRLGALNYVMSGVSDMHYSLIVTSALALSHYLLSSTKYGVRRSVFYLKIDKEVAERTRLLPMLSDHKLVAKLETEGYRDRDMVHPSVRAALKTEVLRTIDQTRQELIDNIISGRMGMLPDFQQISSGYSIFDPLRYAIVWSLVSKLNSLIEGEIGAAGISSLRVVGSNLSNVPPELADYAIIYQSYKRVRKSDLGKFKKEYDKYLIDEGHPEPGPILDEGIAKETLAAASQLNLIYSLDLVSLRSSSSALKYSAILNAEGMQMIYYSLDSSPETCRTTTFSPARVGAIRRVVDSIITSEFNTRDFSKATDLKKFALMIIKGSLRGSVHRSNPYNKNTAESWVSYYLVVIREFLNKQGSHYTRPTERSTREEPLFERIPEDDVLLLGKKIRSRKTVDDYLPSEHGIPEQYEQLTLFVLNMARWGTLPRLLVQVNTMNRILQENYRCTVLPALSMVRTVSYSIVEKVISNQFISGDEADDASLSLENAVQRLNEGVPENFSQIDYLSQIPGNEYRNKDDASFRLLRLTTNFPNDTGFDFPTSIAYSLALPLLLASGHPCFEEVVNVGSSLFHNQTLTQEFESYCLPRSKIDEGLDLGIIVGQSEVEILHSLNEWMGNRVSDSIVVVEIPPEASLFSLGMISWLTSQRLSYVTVALSSDKLGASIYVVAILNEKPPVTHRPSMNINSVSVNLGDSSLGSYKNKILDGNLEILGALYLNPMQQAGIPVFSTLTVRGEIISLSVEEELLDRHRVSFVESTKPSKTTQIYASLEPIRAAYLLRLHRAKNYSEDMVMGAAACAIYYIKALLPDIDILKLQSFIERLISDRDTEYEQIEVFNFLIGIFASMKPIDPSSIQSDAQVLEPDLPKLIFEELAVFEDIEPVVVNLMKLSGKELGDVNRKSEFLTYIRYNKDSLDPGKAWGIISPPKSSAPKKKVRRGAIRELNQQQLEPAAAEELMLQFTEMRLISDRESEHGVSTTRALFRSTFVEDMILESANLPETNDEKLDRLRADSVALMQTADILNLLNQLQEEELLLLSDLNQVELGDALSAMMVEERKKLWPTGGVGGFEF